MSSLVNAFLHAIERDNARSYFMLCLPLDNHPDGRTGLSAMQVVKEAAVGLEIHAEVFLEVVPTPAAGIQDALFLGQFDLLHLRLLGFALGTIPLGKSLMP